MSASFVKHYGPSNAPFTYSRLTDFDFSLPWSLRSMGDTSMWIKPRASVKEERWKTVKKCCDSVSKKKTLISFAPVWLFTCFGKDSYFPKMKSMSESSPRASIVAGRWEKLRINVMEMSGMNLITELARDAYIGLVLVARRKQNISKLPAETHDSYSLTEQLLLTGKLCALRDSALRVISAFWTSAKVSKLREPSLVNTTEIWSEWSRKCIGLRRM